MWIAGKQTNQVDLTCGYCLIQDWREDTYRSRYVEPTIISTVNIMNTNEISADSRNQGIQIQKPRRKLFVLMGMTLGVFALGLILINYFRNGYTETIIQRETNTNADQGLLQRHTNVGKTKQSQSVGTSETTTISASLAKRKKTDFPKHPTRKPNALSGSSASSLDYNTSPSAYSDELVLRLFELIENREELPSQQVNGRINNTLQQLLSLSEAAVPVIQEFLQSKEDLIYDERLVGDRVVDEKSLRIALFDVLDRIGGEEAIEVLGTELQNTSHPLEISALANMLERQAPGEFQDLALAAARKTFASLSNGELPDVDTGPLFQVFADYGNEETISQLVKNNTEWQIYKAVALGQTSEGKGIAELTQLLQNSKDSSTAKVALRMLAQGASQYPEAQVALVEQARSNNIPDQAWPKLALALTGKYQYQLLKPQIDNLTGELERNPFRHESFGVTPMQTLYLTDVSEISLEEREERLAIIDDLLTENDNLLAVKSLEEARTALEQKIPGRNHPVD